MPEGPTEYDTALTHEAMRRGRLLERHARRPHPMGDAYTSGGVYARVAPRSPCVGPSARWASRRMRSG